VNGLYGLLLIAAMPVILVVVAFVLKHLQSPGTARPEPRGSRCNVPAPPLEDWQQ